jgi:hypothetical protein
LDAIGPNKVLSNSNRFNVTFCLQARLQRGK